MALQFRSVAPLICFVVGLWGLPQPASACRLLQFPDRLREASEVVVLAKVKAAAYDGDQSRFYVWRATAEVQRPLVGTTDVPEFEFWGAWESTGCARSKPPPAAGELWVLYLRSQDGRLKIVESYPLEVAREIDPRLAKGDAFDPPL